MVRATTTVGNTQRSVTEMKFIVTIEQVIKSTAEIEMEGDSIMEVFDLMKANLDAGAVPNKQRYIKAIREKKE